MLQSLTSRSSRQTCAERVGACDKRLRAGNTHAEAAACVGGHLDRARKGGEENGSDRPTGEKGGREGRRAYRGENK